MNQKQILPQSPAKSKSSKPIIRSNAFRKTFQDGMPRINHRAIPFHNVYDIEISNIQIARQHGLKFWGCVLPKKRKFNSSGSVSKEKSFQHTRGENMFKKYVKRRPSLYLTPRSYQIQNQESDKKYQTITDFRSQKLKIHQLSEAQKDNNEISRHATIDLHTENKQQSKPESFMITQDEISTINKKSLYQMTPRELEISIQWKKRFLQVFKNKMKEVQDFEFNFRPYHS